MKFSAITLLPTRAENGVWHRVTDTRYLKAAISTAHAKVSPSRFYDPVRTSPQFPTLYLSDSSIVAEFEAEKVIGSYHGIYTSVSGSWAKVSVQVQLQLILDLTNLESLALLDTSTQALTGDWRSYNSRTPNANISLPINKAPTQALGEAIHSDIRNLEGFLALSARVPERRNLIVFPDHLRSRSFLEYEWMDGSGRNKFRVDRDHPDGMDY